MKIKITATILVKNAQKTLKECLESLSDFDEIILLDNFSTDSTLEIAKTFNKHFKNLKIHQSEFIGFGALKNLALNYATNDWILSIDSDEVLESATIEEIKSLKFDTNAIYALPRKNLYNGEWIKACGWHPDYVRRIFNKNFTKFNENIVHESVIIPQNAKLIKLKNPIKHYTANEMESIINKMNFYSSFSAKEKFKNGKKTNMFVAIMRFFLVFLKDYFLRKGFLYGYKGFMIAFLNANGAFLRYAKLYELEKEKNN